MGLMLGYLFKEDFIRVVAGVNNSGESDNERKQQTRIHESNEKKLSHR